MSGIYKGKKAHYNKLILKSLFLGNKTTQQIAEYIFDNTPTKQDRRHIKHIRSNIERPKARLDELRKKGYIKRKTNLEYEATMKGAAMAALEIPSRDLESSLLTKNIESFRRSENFGETLGELKGMFNFDKMGMSKEEVSIMMDAIRGVFGASVISDLRSFAEKLQKRGVDFDRISASEFERMFAVEFAEKMYGQRAKIIAEKQGHNMFKICSNCGREVVGESFRFCPFCANRLES